MPRGGKQNNAGRKPGRALSAGQRLLIGFICHRKLEWITQEHLLAARAGLLEIEHEQKMAKRALRKYQAGLEHVFQTQQAFHAAGQWESRREESRKLGRQVAEEFKETLAIIADDLDVDGRFYHAAAYRAPNGARARAYAETIAEYHELTGRTVSKAQVVEYLKEWRRFDTRYRLISPQV